MWRLRASTQDWLSNKEAGKQPRGAPEFASFMRF